ncbi:Prefoldin beta-like protein [Artomyces pyxidatus]|uniref:Prefoldin beta-like protein n=1 Tax=Artomyces pyxidatus TaxID=48021 RepID=A0ACB8T754_9AGAM|nr:Prefoldin beta-like protein [Artomyces pyxidatus]
MSIEARLQAASNEYQRLQADLSNVVEARQRLDAQLSENELVKKEFASLTPNNTIFKLVGPVLVKQDQTEAKNNVNTRLDFIQGEIKRIEGQLKEIGEKSEKKKQELVELQNALQQQQQPQGSAPPVLST